METPPEFRTAGLREVQLDRIARETKWTLGTKFPDFSPSISNTVTSLKDAALAQAESSAEVGESPASCVPLEELFSSPVVPNAMDAVEEWK